MTFTVRLDEKTKKLLERLSRSEGVSRSEIVRRSIRLFAEQRMARGETNPYETIKHLIGAYGGPGDLSENTGAKFSALLERQARRRR
ncbi:MAG TPA: ribbon-helix-helix protein, CopG family [Thermoanaerobaculia bacterium]|nr:ribbon-helix-helix protein, CopG family [Thermoanaerobaculia bacterium]